MKIYLILFVSILAFSCTEGTDVIDNEQQQITECDCNILILDSKYNRFYISDKKKPFNGHCTIKNANGQVLSERHFKDGKYHGDFIDYYEDGQVKMIREYQNHFINGFEKTYTKDGALIQHLIYKQSTLIETIESHPELKN